MCLIYVNVVSKSKCLRFVCSFNAGRGMLREAAKKCSFLVDSLQKGGGGRSLSTKQKIIIMFFVFFFL